MGISFPQFAHRVWPEEMMEGIAGLSLTTRYCLGILLIGFFVVIVWKLVTGEISLDQLLKGDDSNGVMAFSPGRAQLLIVTLLTALDFVVKAATDPAGGLPKPPGWLVASLGGSQAIYLLEKLWSMKDRRPQI